MQKNLMGKVEWYFYRLVLWIISFGNWLIWWLDPWQEIELATSPDVPTKMTLYKEICIARNKQILKKNFVDKYFWHSMFWSTARPKIYWVAVIAVVCLLWKLIPPLPPPPPPLLASQIQFPGEPRGGACVCAIVVAYCSGWGLFVLY